MFLLKKKDIKILHIVTFLPFSKRLNLSSLIANKVKTNVSLVSIKLFIVRTILCVTV